ncbi:MAG: phospholipase D-like domain-containing protein [Myxococcota bacterium]
MKRLDWLADLSLAELERLARALDAQRVRPGVTVAELRQARLPEGWCEPLTALETEGWKSSTLGQAVWAVHHERKRAQSSTPRVVSTQPGVSETGFVDTGVVLRRLFQQAEREVLLAGFRVTDREMLEGLRRPDAKALAVRLFVDLAPNLAPNGQIWHEAPEVEVLPKVWWGRFLEEIWPEALDAPQGWYAPATLRPGAEGWRSMHIKTVVIDRTHWFVTSANFTTRGRDRNFELGALLSTPKTAEAVLRHFEGMVQSGVFVEFPV